MLRIGALRDQPRRSDGRTDNCCPAGAQADMKARRPSIAVASFREPTVLLSSRSVWLLSLRTTQSAQR